MLPTFSNEVIAKSRAIARKGMKSQKIQFQESFPRISPVKVDPTAGANIITSAHIPITAPIFCGGKICITTANINGRINPVPIPWIIRPKGLLDLRLKDLPDHGIRRHRAKEKRGTFSHGRSIEERPADIETRQEFGHFEADTVLSGKRKGQAVATFVERKSRLTIVKRLNGRDSQSMKAAIVELAHQLNGKLKTLTVDHGKEFADYQAIEALTGTQLYFAHAYSPHERGSNENRNRVLRRFIPRRKPIEELSDDGLVQINWYLNSRPLKCLNWHSPIEIFLLNLRH